MASSTGDSDVHDGEIRLWQEYGCWIAKDVDTGVTTLGESRTAALGNLDDAVALHDGERGRAPTDEQLRAAGIDPADNTTGEREPPDALDCSMDRPTFSGMEVVTVLVNTGGFECDERPETTLNCTTSTRRTRTTADR